MRSEVAAPMHTARAVLFSFLSSRELALTLLSGPWSTAHGVLQSTRLKGAREGPDLLLTVDRHHPVTQEPLVRSASRGFQSPVHIKSIQAPSAPMSLLAALIALFQLGTSTAKEPQSCFFVGDDANMKSGPRACIDPQLPNRSNDGWFACECENATEILRIAPPVSEEAQSLPSFVFLAASTLVPGAKTVWSVTAGCNESSQGICIEGTWDGEKSASRAWAVNNTPAAIRFEVNETLPSEVNGKAEFSGGYATCLTRDISASVTRDPFSSSGFVLMQMNFRPPAEIGSSLLADMTSTLQMPGNPGFKKNFRSTTLGMTISIPAQCTLVDYTIVTSLPASYDNRSSPIMCPRKAHFHVLASTRCVEQRGVILHLYSPPSSCLLPSSRLLPSSPPPPFTPTPHLPTPPHPLPAQPTRSWQPQDRGDDNILCGHLLGVAHWRRGRLSHPLLHTVAF
jgi:hypothetical protein